MKSRIVVALIGAPILIFVILFGEIPLLIFTNFIVGVGTWEFYKMIEASGRKVHKYIGMLASLVLPNYIYWTRGTNVEGEIGILVFALVLMFLCHVFQNRVQNASSEIGITVLGIIYVSYFFSHILKWSFWTNGGQIILLLQVMVWSCDTFAYFIGITIGRKIFKRGFTEISPKKSIEGSLGGIFCTVVAAYLLLKYFSLFLVQTKEELLIFSLVLGIGVSIAAQIGDLVESLFKRECGIKDSGKILAGHGGILDRFDSMIFVLPIMYYIMGAIL